MSAAPSPPASPAASTAGSPPNAISPPAPTSKRSPISPISSPPCPAAASTASPGTDLPVPRRRLCAAWGVPSGPGSVPGFPVGAHRFASFSGKGSVPVPHRRACDRTRAARALAPPGRSGSSGRCTIGSVDPENINLHEELKKLREQIEHAAELAALKPIYFRLNEIIQAYPGDFEVQFTGNDMKQRLMARGTLLKQQETSPPPPPPAPEMPAAPPPPLPTSFLDTMAPVPVALPEPPVGPAATPSPMSFPFFDSTPPEQPPPALRSEERRVG